MTWHPSTVVCVFLCPFSFSHSHTAPPTPAAAILSHLTSFATESPTLPFVSPTLMGVGFPTGPLPCATVFPSALSSRDNRRIFGLRRKPRIARKDGRAGGLEVHSLAGSLALLRTARRKWLITANFLFSSQWFRMRRSQCERILALVMTGCVFICYLGSALE